MGRSLVHKYPFGSFAKNKTVRLCAKADNILLGSGPGLYRRPKISHIGSVMERLLVHKYLLGPQLVRGLLGCLCDFRQKQNRVVLCQSGQYLARIGTGSLQMVSEETQDYYHVTCGYCGPCLCGLRRAGIAGCE